MNNNNLLTESEGCTGIYQTEVLLYWALIQQDRGLVFSHTARKFEASMFFIICGICAFRNEFKRHTRINRIMILYSFENLLSQLMLSSLILTLSALINKISWNFKVFVFLTGPWKLGNMGKSCHASNQSDCAIRQNKCSPYNNSYYYLFQEFWLVLNSPGLHSFQNILFETI
jgi:hypothetical protein